MLSILSPKNFGTPQISRLGTWGLKSEIGHVTHQSIGNLIQAKKIYTFRGVNMHPEPKNGIWSPKSVWSWDISIDREKSCCTKCDDQVVEDHEPRFSEKQ
jgi:hypothetical protein